MTIPTRPFLLVGVCYEGGYTFSRTVESDDYGLNNYKNLQEYMTNVAAGVIPDEILLIKDEVVVLEVNYEVRHGK